MAEKTTLWSDEIIFSGETSRLSESEPLRTNPIVHLSENEFGRDQYDTGLVQAFEHVTSALRVLEVKNDLPHLQVHPAFMPSWDSLAKARGDALGFLVAWGESTDIPLPRIEKLPDYFGGLRIAIAERRRRSKPLDKVTMDAQGMLGWIEMADGVPMLRMVTRSADGKKYQATRLTTPNKRIGLLGVDIATLLQDNRPLRFHSMVRYFGPNRSVICHYYKDDESHLLDRFVPLPTV